MTKKRKKKEAKEIDLKDIKTVKFNINISVPKEEFDELLSVSDVWVKKFETIAVAAPNWYQG